MTITYFQQQPWPGSSAADTWDSRQASSRARLLIVRFMWVSIMCLNVPLSLKYPPTTSRIVQTSRTLSEQWRRVLLSAQYRMQSVWATRERLSFYLCSWTITLQTGSSRLVGQLTYWHQRKWVKRGFWTQASRPPADIRTAIRKRFKAKEYNSSKWHVPRQDIWQH